MNNKMTINTYLPTNGSKKKQQTRTETEPWIQEYFDGCQMGGGCWGMGEEVRALRRTNRQLQNSHGDIKYRKWSNQRSYMHDPWI